MILSFDFKLEKNNGESSYKKGDLDGCIADVLFDEALPPESPEFIKIGEGTTKTIH